MSITGINRLNITSSGKYDQYRESLFAHFEAYGLRIFSTECRELPKSMRIVFSATDENGSTQGKQALEIIFPMYKNASQVAKAAQALADLWEQNYHVE